MGMGSDEMWVGEREGEVGRVGLGEGEGALMNDILSTRSADLPYLVMILCGLSLL